MTEPMKMTKGPSGKDWKEGNDCVIRSLVLVTGRPYYKVAQRLHMAAILNGGHKKSSGWFTDELEAAMDVLGISWLEDDEPNDRVGRFASTAKGRWLILSARHLTGVKHGITSDRNNWYEPCRKVYAILAH